jgi:hypothetical protein
MPKFGGCTKTVPKVFFYSVSERVYQNRFRPIVQTIGAWNNGFGTGQKLIGTAVSEHLIRNTKIINYITPFRSQKIFSAYPPNRSPNLSAYPPRSQVAGRKREGRENLIVKTRAYVRRTRGIPPPQLHGGNRPATASTTADPMPAYGARIPTAKARRASLAPRPARHPGRPQDPARATIAPPGAKESVGSVKRKPMARLLATRPKMPKPNTKIT